MKLIIVIALLIAGTACTQMKQTAWVPPSNLSGRETIRDKLTCKELSRTSYDLGARSASDHLFNMAMTMQAKKNFEGCMQEAGYTKVEQ